MGYGFLPEVFPVLSPLGRTGTGALKCGVACYGEGITLLPPARTWRVRLRPKPAECAAFNKLSSSDAGVR
jgi:hypothetical protein